MSIGFTGAAEFAKGCQEQTKMV